MGGEQRHRTFPGDWSYRETFISSQLTWFTPVDLDMVVFLGVVGGIFSLSPSRARFSICEGRDVSGSTLVRHRFG